jgi:hypothetical protein
VQVSYASTPSQYEHDAYGVRCKWARFIGVTMLPTQPISDDPSQVHSVCTIRDRGRPRRSTVASVQ